MKNNNRKQSAFTLVEIMIVMAIIGFVAAIAIPSFVKYLANSQQNACTANLREIASAKVTWALETNRSNADTPGSADLFGATGYIRVEPKCPTADTSYVIARVDQAPTCAITAHNP